MSAINLTRDNRKRFAQAGLLARGILYVIVGALALQIAFGNGGGGQQTSQQGALQKVASQPFGTVLVALLGLGLVGYALWRLSQFFTEGGGQEGGAQQWIQRASYIVRALIYAALSVFAFSLAFGNAGGGSGGAQQSLTARVMSWPGGRIMVGIAGLVIIGVGLYQAYQAYSDDFMDELRTEQMTPQTRRWVERVGKAGHSARALVFSLIGIFVIRAAVQFDPQESAGLDGALQTLAQQPAGPWLLGLTALGLLLYGVYSIVRARYVDVSE